MAVPEAFERRVAKQIVDIYANAETQLLDIVARRAVRGIDEPGWAERKLAEVQALRTEAEQVVERLTDEARQATFDDISDAYSGGATRAAKDLDDELTTVVEATFQRTSERAVARLARETVSGLQSTHFAVLRQTADIYRDVVADVASQAVTGAATRRQAAAQALDRWAKRGVTGFVDSAGRRWELTSYAEMSLRTGVQRAHLQGTVDRLTASNRELVLVSDAPEECPLCRDWEGKVLALSREAAKHPAAQGTLAEAKADGLFHPSCRHTVTAYIPGTTQRARARTRTQDRSGFEQRQRQRTLERQIRTWKRRAAVAEAAGDDEQAAYARRHLRERQTTLREFVDQHNRKRLRYREQTGAR